MLCFFVSDLHGHVDRYEKLFAAVLEQRPTAVFLGGDLLPNPWVAANVVEPRHRDFVHGFLGTEFAQLRSVLGAEAPRVFLILGNDDGRFQEPSFLSLAAAGCWEYVHDRRVAFFDWTVYGYSCVPPSPFQLKDWERYDVSRFIDPGCVSPEEGMRSVPVSPEVARYATIAKDLDSLVGEDDMTRAIFLFHAPPYQTDLDRAALDGMTVDHAPLDVHIGSIAVRRMIECRQPYLSLHGHVHEAPRITGQWRGRIGRTQLFTAAHDGPELALVRFDPAALDAAERTLL